MVKTSDFLRYCLTVLLCTVTKTVKAVVCVTPRRSAVSEIHKPSCLEPTTTYQGKVSKVIVLLPYDWPIERTGVSIKRLVAIHYY